jgi:hypothetical protein
MATAVPLHAKQLQEGAKGIALPIPTTALQRGEWPVPRPAFFFLCWRYNPLRVLDFSAIFFHSVLSLLSFLHPLIPIV